MSGVIFLSDPNYPALLREIPNPPQKLYFMGDWDASIFEKCIGIVGSRRITNYGTKVTQKLAGEMAMAGFTVVSGFMYGVDTEAHKACLNVGGRTVAVMPCGVDIIHPERNSLLYSEIIENRGLIVSEFPSGHPPGKWTYPKRNRIIAGLSGGVVVVEAAQKSGSIITAKYAKKYDRKVFAVPGPITSENTFGVIDLLRGGAMPVGSSKEILTELKLNTDNFTDNYAQLGEIDKYTTNHGLENRLLNALRNESLSIDELSHVLKESDIAKLSSKITLLVLKGVLIEEEGRYYAN